MLKKTQFSATAASNLKRDSTRDQYEEPFPRIKIL